jgi:photosystem II stability/assembly factor-like uncharacterized protein
MGDLFIRNCLWMAAILIAAILSAQTDRPAELMPVASRSLLLDVALAGDRLVAVGERGHILLSDDYGRSWQQVPAPTRTTLTAVHFADPQNGWAVGHENVILATRDGGKSWSQQFPPGTIDERFLDIHFLDARNGLAVGAYGWAHATGNGGKAWEPREISLDQMHLNRISRGPDGRLFIAVEGGQLLTSGDGGEEWNEIPSPYDGSLFGVLPLGPRTLLTYGLRGNVFRSTDTGQNWARVETPILVLIMHGIRLSGGQIILAGQNGQFLISGDGGRSFELWRVPVQGATALAECPDGAVIAVGHNGVHRLSPPRPSQQKEAP